MSKFGIRCADGMTPGTYETRAEAADVRLGLCARGGIPLDDLEVVALVDPEKITEAIDVFYRALEEARSDLELAYDFKDRAEGNAWLDFVERVDHYFGRFA